MKPFQSKTWDRYRAKTLYMPEARLTSVQGAREIIKTLSRRDAVACLILRHNKLGDEGCAELFKYLCSEDGQRHKIVGILLNNNRLGNVALESIGNFLRNNKRLKEIYLASNDFVGNSDVITSFVDALNSSSLKSLSFSNCDRLSDNFAERFLPHLDSPHLVNLHLSKTGLTRAAVPHLVDYLSSPRSRHLAGLKLSGNNLTQRGAARIVRSMQANFNLTSMEMYGIRTLQGDQEDSGEGSSGDGSVTIHGETTRFAIAMRWVLSRNELLRKDAQAEALQLLRYSRALLLEPRRTNEDKVRRPPFHIQSLPTELQLHILSLTVDTLSANQRIRIFRFASDLTTLPPLLPDLRMEPEEVPELDLLEKNSAPVTLSPRDTNRAQWLQTVGCDIYEL